ncbi:MAG: photosynthetic complex putative assembly protein PuhB [Burkholderiaceae bacterium]|nr:photosynthetic complex putative assembly protein PuhB [Burkholderiaceae bacterium]MCX8004463.1 photosynthetic complex putative assembly protein PuhB [Burkholderiaceae bacterium]
MSTAAGRDYIAGIRDPLPAGERLLWQGAPQWRALAVHAFHVRKVALYFGLLLLWRIAAATADGLSAVAAVAAAVPLLGAATVALALLALLAWAYARTTIYAITDRRVFLRIGVALPLYVNLPFDGIDGATLRRRGPRGGDLLLQLRGGVRLAYLHLWPHVRPWHLRSPQPMLRGLADALTPAGVLARALAQAAGQPVQWQPAAPPATGPAVGGQERGEVAPA